MKDRQVLGELFKYVVTSDYEKATINMEVYIVGQLLVSRVIHMANTEEYTVMNLVSLLLRKDVGDDGSVALERAADCFQEYIHDTVLLPIVEERCDTSFTGRGGKVRGRELLKCVAAHNEIEGQVELNLNILDESSVNRVIKFSENSELHYGSILELFMDDDVLNELQQGLNIIYGELIDYMVHNSNNLSEEEAMLEVSNVDWKRKRR